MINGRTSPCHRGMGGADTPPGENEETVMEVLLRMLEISEKVKKAKTMSRIYLSDNYEYQEVAGPLDDALELLWDFLEE